MTEIEYKAWCWSNKSQFIENWKKFDIDEEGIHLYCQGQPIKSPESLETTFIVKYMFGWNGSLEKNGLYFSITIENRNSELSNMLTQVIMSVFDGENLIENFCLPIYPSGCNQSVLEFSLTESKNIPELVKLIEILQENKSFSVSLDFINGDRFFPVHTILNGKLDELGQEYHEIFMLQRTRKRLLNYVKIICERVPEAVPYFQNIDENAVSDRFSELLLECSNIKSVDKYESFDLAQNTSTDDICFRISKNNKTISLENLVISHASLFSFGIIELALARLIILSKGFSFTDKSLVADVIRNMNNPYFNQMNPKSPLDNLFDNSEEFE